MLPVLLGEYRTCVGLDGDGTEMCRNIGQRQRGIGTDWVRGALACATAPSWQVPLFCGDAIWLDV